MFRLTIFLVSTLLHFNLFAFEEFKASYGMYLSDVRVAEETRILKKNKDIYIFSSSAKTSDLGKFFGDRKITSKSIINHGNGFIDLESFISKETERNKPDENIRVAFKKHGKLIISSQRNKQNSTETFELDLQPLDPLSSTLILSENLKNGINFSEKKYLYADGKKNRIISVEQLENLVMKFQAKDYKVIPLKFSNEKYSVVAFFAPSLEYVPLEIEKQTKNKKFFYRLEDIEFYK